MRLDKYLCDMSVASRSEIKKLAKDKRIMVNGSIITDSSFSVDFNDDILVDNQRIEYVQFEYYILNKPQGYICALQDKQYPTIMELVTSKRKDLVPVGRLDKDTEGIILITNDGILNHKLLAKDNHVLKKYYVVTDVSIPDNACQIMSEPIQFKEFTSKPGKLEIIDSNSAYLTISEGKFHQVKRMFNHIGCNVTYLKRVSFGPLQLDDLKIGQYRKLTQQEVDVLKQVCK